LPTYQELLLDPRWQRKRLMIMLRDNFTCQRCFNDRETLCIHHFAYQPGLLPWEYDDEDLITWCIICHENEHCKLKYQDIAENLVSKPFTMERSLILDGLIIKYGI
jgi:5-methylcytosine-specific restriction endonuclease McrA